MLSNPTISTTDGQPAVIEVGKDIPVETDSTIIQDGKTIVSTQKGYKRVGISLQITPYINNNNDEITLAIHTILSEAGEEKSIGSKSCLPEIYVREADSIVRIAHGEEVVLGGLIQRQRNTIIKKIPLLGELPVIGPLFSSQGNAILENELIIVIVPYIVDLLPTRKDKYEPFYDILDREYIDVETIYTPRWIDREKYQTEKKEEIKK